MKLNNKQIISGLKMSTIFVAIYGLIVKARRTNKELKAAEEEFNKTMAEHNELITKVEAELKKSKELSDEAEELIRQIKDSQD